MMELCKTYNKTPFNPNNTIENNNFLKYLIENLLNKKNIVYLQSDFKTDF